MEKVQQINKKKLPQHIAIIMDGNGRWAKRNGKSRVFGHKNGVKSVREVVETSAKIGIKFLTLYAFSTENWARPKKEVAALMELLVITLKKELDNLMKNDICLKAIGHTDSLPPNCRNKLKDTIQKTSKNKRMTLILALGYSSKWEITTAIKNITKDVVNGALKQEEINEQTISGYLNTKDIPDPELLIRTSGETRISNFLLWQIAYSELYFTNTLWPDFRENDLYEAIIDFQNRERRFGKISEQFTT